MLRRGVRSSNTMEYFLGEDPAVGGSAEIRFYEVSG